MKQTSFSDAEFAHKKKQTRRDRFLAEIEAVTPWAALVAALLPYYPKGDGRVRPPVGLERMLRMYIAQQCFGLSDEGIEDAIYDSQSIRGFVGIDLTHESAPDATTLLKFRRLLEKHHLTRRIFDEINGYLASKGLVIREGTIVDATLIAAPPSTKNRDKESDPEMHQSKKGNDWHFGMKAHVGVDMTTGLVHSVVGTAGNVADVTQAHALLHGDEKAVLGDAGYQGVGKRPENADKAIDWHTAMRPSVRKALKKNPLGRAKEKLEQTKASVRAKVEHCFHVVKCLFKHRKTRYRGLAKNNAQLFTLFGFANLVLAACRKLGATLVIAKLDRLARNVHFVSGLMESKVKFVACDMPDANELTIHMMAAFAEHEAKWTSQRTEEALAVAKARGVELGKAGAANLRPNVEQRQATADAFAEKLRPIFAGMGTEKLSQRGMVERLNTVGIPTSTGEVGKWRLSQVQRILGRLGA